MDDLTPVEGNNELARTKSGALVSVNDTKYLQRKNTKQARKQSMATEQRIAYLERQVDRLLTKVSELESSKVLTPKKNTKKKD